MEAVILAAGKGRRLKNKYSLLINNKTLIEHQYDKLKKVATKISVVYSDLTIKQIHKHLDVEWVFNESGEKIDSVKLGIGNCTSSCLLVLADMINVTYQKFLSCTKTTFSYNDVSMPPAFIDKNDFEYILKNDFTNLKDLISHQTINISDIESNDIDYISDVIGNRKNIIVVSGGELASGTINLLAKKGFNVIVVEKASPLAVRRQVSYCEAMHEGRKRIEGVTVVKAEVESDIKRILNEGNYPIITDTLYQEINLNPFMVIDIAMRKKRIKHDLLSIGVGPGFVASDDVTYVVESMRGENLGKVIISGSASKNTGIPTNICGYDIDRVVYSNGAGIFTSTRNIGEKIKSGDIFGYVDKEEVYAKISGVIRGQIRNNTYIKNNVKIGDINPIENNIDIYKFSDKTLKIATSILKIVEETNYEKSRGNGHLLKKVKNTVIE